MFSKISERTYVFSLILIMIAFGVIGVKIGKIGLLVGLIVLGWGILTTIQKRNKYNTAHYIAGFFVGAEVFLRMSSSGLPWEFTKYVIIILFTIALIVDNKERKFSVPIAIYMFLLLPALYLTVSYYQGDIGRIKIAVASILMGPISLFVSVMYFYKYKMTKEDFKILSRWIVLGVIPMSVYILLTVGDYSSIEYTGSSNMDSSGGFSGNQVSVGFGIGILFLVVNLIINQPLFYYKIIDVFLVGLFILQGLLTFSRGGIMTTVVGVAIAMIVYNFSKLQRFIEFITKKFVYIVLGVVFATGVFLYVDDVTGGALYTRYFNEKADGTQSKSDLTTGRGDIILGDWILFETTDYVGVGVGVSARLRPLYKNFAPHVEYSRLLAEHGILGVIMIFILLYLPLKSFFEIRKDSLNMVILLSMSFWALMTMTHAAMRQGAVGFIYGLAFIILVSTYKKKVEE